MVQFILYKCQNETKKPSIPPFPPATHPLETFFFGFGVVQTYKMYSGSVNMTQVCSKINFKVDYKVDIKRDYRGAVREYFKQSKVGRKTLWRK